MRRYAQDTTVPVAKSRAEIDALLRRWNCGQIRWTDDFASGTMRLEFVWERGNGDQFLARYDVLLPTEDELRYEARHASSGAFLPSKFAKLIAARGRVEMRQLALLIRAKLNAVESGIVSAEDEFLAHLVGPNGQTVAEVCVPQLARLNEGKMLMLPEGGRR